jgi:hypothetical protein
MSTVLGFIAMISRLFVLSHHVVNHTATLYNSLIIVLPHYKLLNEQEFGSIATSEQMSLINTLKHIQFFIGPLPSALITFESSHLHNRPHQHQQNTKSNKKRSRKSQFKSHELGDEQDEDLGGTQNTEHRVNPINSMLIVVVYLEPIEENVFFEGRNGVQSFKIATEVDKKIQNQNELIQRPTKKRKLEPNFKKKFQALYKKNETTFEIKKSIQSPDKNLRRLTN